jgi:hypothetical protein
MIKYEQATLFKLIHYQNEGPYVKNFLENIMPLMLALGKIELDGTCLYLITGQPKNLTD